MVFYILYITIVNKGEITNKDSNRGKIIRVCMSFYIIFNTVNITQHNRSKLWLGFKIKRVKSQSLKMEDKITSGVSSNGRNTITPL
jgi:hypothetical protein